MIMRTICINLFSMSSFSQVVYFCCVNTGVGCDGGPVGVHNPDECLWSSGSLSCPAMSTYHIWNISHRHSHL